MSKDFVFILGRFSNCHKYYCIYLVCLKRFHCSILREGHPEQVVVPVRAAAEPGHAQPAAARPRHAGGGEGGSGATVLPQRHEVPPPQLRPRRQEGQQRRAGHLPHQPGGALQPRLIILLLVQEIVRARLITRSELEIMEAEGDLEKIWWMPLCWALKLTREYDGALMTSESP